MQITKFPYNPYSLFMLSIWVERLNSASLIHGMINSSRAAGGRANGDGANKARTRDRPRGVPAPEANAELQVNIDVCSKNLLSYQFRIICICFGDLVFFPSIELLIELQVSHLSLSRSYLLNWGWLHHLFGLSCNKPILFPRPKYIHDEGMVPKRCSWSRNAAKFCLFLFLTEKKVSKSCKCEKQERKVSSPTSGWCSRFPSGFFKSNGPTIWTPRSNFLQHRVCSWEKLRAYLVWAIGQFFRSWEPKAETQVQPLIKTTGHRPRSVRSQEEGIHRENDSSILCGIACTMLGKQGMWW